MKSQKIMQVQLVDVESLGLEGSRIVRAKVCGGIPPWCVNAMVRGSESQAGRRDVFLARGPPRLKL